MIYVSSSIIKRDSIESCIEDLIDVGINNIELSGGGKYCPQVSRLLRRFKESYGLNLLIHNYFPPPEKDFVLNIASIDREIRRRSVDFVKTSITLACELGIDLYTLHAGYTKDLTYDPASEYFIADGPEAVRTEEALEIMYQTISEVGEYAKACGVRVGLENLFPIDGAPECSLLCKPSEIFQFLDHTSDDGNIGLLLDLGHLFICSNYFGFDKDEFIRKLSESYQNRVVGVHLSENDGRSDQHRPLKRKSWQLDRAKLFDIRKTSVAIECRGLEANEARKQLEMVQSVLEGKV